MTEEAGFEVLDVLTFRDYAVAPIPPLIEDAAWAEATLEREQLEAEYTKAEHQLVSARTARRRADARAALDRLWRQVLEAGIAEKMAEAAYHAAYWRQDLPVPEDLQDQIARLRVARANIDVRLQLLSDLGSSATLAGRRPLGGRRRSIGTRDAEQRMRAIQLANMARGQAGALHAEMQAGPPRERWDRLAEEARAAASPL